MDRNTVRAQICTARERLDCLLTALAPSHDLPSDFIQKTQQEVSNILDAFIAKDDYPDQRNDVFAPGNPAGRESQTFQDQVAGDLTESGNKQNINLFELQQFVATFRNVGDAVITTNEEGVVVSFNEAAQALTGWSEAEALGCPMGDIFHLVDEATGLEYECSIDAVIKCGTVTGLKKYGVMACRDGRKFVIASSGIPIRDAEGKIIRVVLVLRDMTEKAQLERELFRQREDYEAIFNAAPQRIWYFDEKGKVLRVNDCALRSIGLPRDEVVGKTVYDFFPTHAHILVDRHRQVISSGKPILGSLENILLPNDQLRWTRVDRIPFKNKEGRIEGVIVLVDDITEKKQRDDALRESQRMLSTLMSNLPGMAYRCLNDKNWTMTFVSEGCLKLTEYQPAELVRNRKISYSQLIHPDDREWVRRYIESAVEQKQSFHCTYRVLTASGKEKWVLEQGCGIYGPDGTLETLEGFIADVTDRLRAQEALHASESFLKSIFTSMADAVFCFDANGRFVLYHIPPDKTQFFPMYPFMGKLAADVFPPHVAKLFQEGFERNRSNQIASADFCAEADHTQFWFSAKISPIFLDGEYKGSVAVVRDISERKNFEHALSESEERYRSFVQSFHGIAFRSDKNFKLCFIHGEVELITGYTAEEFLLGGVKLNNILHPEDLPKMFSITDSFVNGTLLTFDQEYRIIRKDGQVCYIREMIHRLFDITTNETYFQGVIYDITETKRVETELNEYRDKMIRSEHMASLGTLGSAIAHQLNQPLTAIRLFLQQSLRALDKDTGIENVKEKIQDSLVEITNATAMINRFLRYTHLQPEAMGKKVSLASAANKIVTIMSDRARWAKVTLVLEDLGKMPEIEGSEGEIEQIFFILIQNAIQAANADKPSRLEISARLVEGQVELKFADTCSGISPENLQKVFEPFFTTKSSDQGTGLGLCILNRIINRRGGKISVQSQLGQGTTFQVTLPVQ